MKLPRPSAPFERLDVRGESIILDTSGNILVLPTGDTSILTGFNEYTIGRNPLTAGTYIFTDDPDAGTGLQNMFYPLVCVYDSTDTKADFFLFTDRPKNLSCVVDSSGVITSITLYPGNGKIYRGRIIYSDLTRDTNNDGIPDFLDSSISGSITNFLQSYDFSTLLVTTLEGDFITTLEGETWEVN